ncbi:MAG: S41 family peptidase [Verrucomicrobiota bacterium]
MKSPKSYLLTYTLIFFLVGFVVMMIAKPHRRGLFSPSYWQNLSQYGEAMLLINHYHIEEDKTGYEALTDDALGLMIGNLDPYSQFMDEDAFNDFEMRTDQHYAGIGAEIERMDSRVTLIGIFDGSPAQQAGLKVGDEIVRIGEEDAQNLSVVETAQTLRGPVGTEATLTIYRPGERREFAYTLERQKIDTPTIREVAVDADDVGYLKVSHFGRNTGQEFAQALDLLEDGGMRALIIDLRGNPGGLLSEAIAMVSEFTLPGQIVVTTRDGEGNILREARAKGKGPRKAYPIAILMNPGSASASEIVAGAMQDLGKAIVVGDVSLGKGSVQSIHEIGDGDGLRLTTAMYFLPSGRTIHQTGVVPDIVVDLSTAEQIDLRLHRSRLRLMDEDAFTARFGFEPVHDTQLERAHRSLLGALAFEPS